MSKKSLVIIVLSCVVFGGLMLVRYELDSTLLRAVAAALAAACLAGGISYGSAVKK